MSKESYTPRTHKPSPVARIDEGATRVARANGVSATDEKAKWPDYPSRPFRKRKMLTGLGLAGVALAVTSVGLFAKSKIDENHNREIDKYQIDEELLLDDNFNKMTDEELIDAGYTVIRAGEGEILSEFGERVGEQLAVGNDLAMELVEEQGRTRDGNAAFGAGERFIFQVVPEQPQP